MGSVRPALLLVGLVALVVFVNSGQVWAQTVTPSSPIAFQSFTISGTRGGGAVAALDVGTGSVCEGAGTLVFSTIMTGTPGPYSQTVPGQNAGPYWVNVQFDGCTLFTITPVTIPEYPYGLLILATFMVIGYAAIKRRISH